MTPAASRIMIIAAVIRKVHDALLPGAELHLIGETANDERTGPWEPAHWGLAGSLSRITGTRAK